MSEISPVVAESRRRSEQIATECIDELHNLKFGSLAESSEKEFITGVTNEKEFRDSFRIFLDWVGEPTPTILFADSPDRMREVLSHHRHLTDIMVEYNNLGPHHRNPLMEWLNPHRRDPPKKIVEPPKRENRNEDLIWMLDYALGLRDSERKLTRAGDAELEDLHNAAYSAVTKLFGEPDFYRKEWISTEKSEKLRTIPSSELLECALAFEALKKHYRFDNPSHMWMGEHIRKMQKNCAFLAWFDDVLIVCRKPLKFHLDSKGRFHHKTDPVVQWADSDQDNGQRVYGWHGYFMDEKVVKNPSALSIEDILRVQNVEVRKMLISEIGQERLCKILKAKLIDEQEIVIGDKVHKYELYSGKGSIDRNDVIQQWRIISEEIVVKCLKMINPSTGGTHWEFVNHKCGSVRTALKFRNGTDRLPAVLT